MLSASPNSTLFPCKARALSSQSNSRLILQSYGMQRMLGLRRPALALAQRHWMVYTHPRIEEPNCPSQFERPSPPRLPTSLQKEFERLQKEAGESPTGNIGADGNELHPDVRQAKHNEFEGDRNPITGEIGDPRTEPTRHGDWSFGGRTSDF
jgi:hypothetical protein